MRHRLGRRRAAQDHPVCRPLRAGDLRMDPHALVAAGSRLMSDRRENSSGTRSPRSWPSFSRLSIIGDAGEAIVETVFGALSVGSGDYVLIPRSTTHRWVPQGNEELRAYCIEANSHITPARQLSLSFWRQLLAHAPYCERDLRGPEGPLLVGETDVEVFIKHRDRSAGVTGTVVTHESHPFDVVGWDGCLYPYVFNVADYEPITGRVPSTAAKPSGLRREQLRRLQLRSAEGRLPPESDPCALLPLERRQR